MATRRSSRRSRSSRNSRHGNSPYKSSTTYIERMLAKVPPAERKAQRLALDLASLLTGPTSGGHARELVDLLFRANTPEDIAADLRIMVNRYFR